VNTVFKSLIQPALLFALAAILPMPNALVREGAVVAALPSAVIVTMLAARYRAFVKFVKIVIFAMSPKNIGDYNHAEGVHCLMKSDHGEKAQRLDTQARTPFSSYQIANVCFPLTFSFCLLHFFSLRSEWNSGRTQTSTSGSLQRPSWMAQARFLRDLCGRWDETRFISSHNCALATYTFLCSRAPNFLSVH
jgi:hypothetical protein